MGNPGSMGFFEWEDVRSEWVDVQYCHNYSLPVFIYHLGWLNQHTFNHFNGELVIVYISRHPGTRDFGSRSFTRGYGEKWNHSFV